MDKIKSIINLFRAGYSLRNSAGWKSVAVNANLVTLITATIAVLHAYGYAMPYIAPEVIAQLTTAGVAASGGIMALYNIVIHVITTDKIGILADNVTPTQNNVVTPVIEKAAPDATTQAQNIL